MNVQQQIETAASGAAAHFDVLIVGAGISGVGAAYHLTRQCPGTSFVVLEAQDELRRHLAAPTAIPASAPTATSTPSATASSPGPARRSPRAAEILHLYGRGDRGERPRPPHPLSAPDPARRIGRATEALDASRRRGPTPARRCVSPPNFLWMCQGYYRHAEGYTPQWAGMETFKGRIVHPQTWPDDLDYAGKKVVVIGSGATAATLIPAIAEDCAHVTMLQRSPTYFRTGRNAIELADDPARAAGRRELDPRDRAPQDPARPGRLHPQVLRGARGGEEGSAVRGRGLSRTRLRHRHPLHAELPAVAAAHRLHPRRRPVPGHQVRQGLGGHRRDRALHRDRASC